jgi:hypothetical protein
MQFNFASIARAAMTALLVSASAQATIISEFTNLGDWMAATTNQVTQNFTGSDQPGSGAAGLTLAGINYLGYYTENNITSYSTYRFNPFPAVSIGTGAYMLGGNNGWFGSSGYVHGLVINLLSPATTPQAISFNYSAFRVNNSNNAFVYSTAGNPIVLLMELYESNVLTETRNLTVPFSSGSPVAGYFGFTVSGTVSSVRLLIDSPAFSNTDRIILDNFAYAQIAANNGGGEIPEPATYLITAAGLFALASLRKR